MHPYKTPDVVDIRLFVPYWRNAMHPYKTPDVVDIVPVSGPLTQFVEHEKSLAIVGIYRPAIGACHTVEDLEKLKLYARAEIDKRVSPNSKDLYNKVLQAIVWFHTVTLDDCKYFRNLGDGATSTSAVPSLWGVYKWPVIFGVGGSVVLYLLEHLFQ